MTDHKYGPNGHIVDAFIEHLTRMTLDARDTAWSAAGSAAWSAAGFAARSAAWSAARSAAGDAARYTAWSAAWDASRDASRDAARDAAGYAAWEIQGSDIMRERGQPFFFLPLFGFADEQAVIAAPQPNEDK